MAQQRNLTETELEELFVKLSNWGKWGKDDQLGALNYVTAAKIAEAGSLVRAGVSYLDGPALIDQNVGRQSFSRSRT